ncbi:MFS transporter [Frigidibacter sp. MR17.24]|uniref:MFS transporter n=1 Tax=Frigidibacter sp. MR17.24 TaxID=3127345 RepID=UPI003012CB37
MSLVPVQRPALLVAWQPALALALCGMAIGSFSASMPDLKARAGAGDGETGIALIAAAVGGMAAMHFGPAFAATAGRRVLGAAGLLAAAAVLAPLLGTGPLALIPALMLFGAGASLLDIVGNLVVAEQERTSGRRLMNLAHACYSFGFAGAALATSAARAAGQGPAQILPVAAGLIALGALALPRGPAPAPEAQEEGGGGGLPWAAVLPAGGIIFAAIMGENATEAWSALHIERTLGAAHGAGSLGPTLFGLTMGSARVGAHLVAGRVGETRLVGGSCLLAVAGVIAVALAPVPAVAMAGVVAAGAGLAVAVPSAVSMLGARVTGRARARAISRALTIGYTGFFVGPSLIGFVAELAGLRAAFLAVALTIALALPAVRALARVRAGA